MCANAGQNKHALRARLCKANADRAVNARYMSTGKEVNDLRCIAADIAESIKARSAGKLRLLSGDRGLSKLAEATLSAKSIGATRDHAALWGSCGCGRARAAIAALSMVILPHLGIFGAVRLQRRLLRAVGVRTRGTRYGRRRMAPGRFHIRPAPQTTPNTFTPPDDLHFRELHRWDEVAQSPRCFKIVQTP